MNGFFIIDKAEGLTSSQVVQKIKRQFKIKKAGHIGTLDPMATGVLPVALGEATKVIPYLDENIKIYSGVFLLGQATDTYDRLGKIIHEGNPAVIQEETIQKQMAELVGEIDQIPPIYSSLKKAGKPYYYYARQGITFEIPSRKVKIDEFRMIKKEGFAVSFYLKCGRGTYVRSLVHDLGVRLSCYAHLTELRRLQSGRFTLEQAVPLAELNPNHLLSVGEALFDFPRIMLSMEEEREIRYGRCLKKSFNEEKLHENQPLLLTRDDKVLAVACLDAKVGLKPLRVLNG